MSVRFCYRKKGSVPFSSLAEFIAEYKKLNPDGHYFDDDVMEYFHESPKNLRVLSSIVYCCMHCPDETTKWPGDPSESHGNRIDTIPRWCPFRAYEHGLAKPYMENTEVGCGRDEPVGFYVLEKIHLHAHNQMSYTYKYFEVDTLKPTSKLGVGGRKIAGDFIWHIG